MSCTWDVRGIGWIWTFVVDSDEAAILSSQHDYQRRKAFCPAQSRKVCSGMCCSMDFWHTRYHGTVINQLPGTPHPCLTPLPQAPLPDTPTPGTPA